MKITWIAAVSLVVLCGVLISAGMVGPANAKTLRFDLGTEQSELRPGFTRLTAQSLYRKEVGYGWESTEGLKQHHKYFSREWEYSVSRGREQPSPIYTNQVTCDCVRGDRPGTLLCDLPPGEYVAWLLFGLSAGSTREYHDFDVTVSGVEKPAQATVRIPGPYHFEKRVMRVKLLDGQLAVDLTPRTDWMLAAVVIFPAAEERAVRAEFLDDLEKEIDFLPPDVAEKWQETPHVDPRPMPEFSLEDRRRGYAIFARHWSEVIYPNTVPRAEELNPVLAAFASLGEYEPATFTVLPLENLTDARVTASDLRFDDSVIPAANIEIRKVRYMRVRPNYSTFFRYHLAPDVLDSLNSTDDAESVNSLELEQGTNQRFWITVKVPKDAKAGIHEGRLTFNVAGKEPADVRFRLRVLPIRLKKSPEPVYGMYYRDPLANVRDGNSPGANAYFSRKAEWERQDMVAHGMNSHISSVSGLERDDEGRWTMDGTETERRIALDRKHGLADKPLVVSIPVGSWYSRLIDRQGLGSHLRLVRDEVPESFFDEVTKMVEAVEREKRRYDWPEFLYYPIDEPNTQESSVRFMVGVLDAIKRVPGVRTYVTADPSHEQFEPMWPYVDVWCCQPFVFGHEKIRRLSQEKNIEFWCYPNHISGENDHTPVRGARMTWGFGFWKSGFRALIPWIYQSSSGSPQNHLDGTSMDFFNRSTPEGRPIPVTLWEAYREGIDDGRYLYTLQEQIAENEKLGGPAAERAAQAKREVQFVRDSIEVQEKYKYDDLWSGPDFDAYRWLLASEILALHDSNAIE